MSPQRRASNRRGERRFCMGSGQTLKWRKVQAGARGRQGWLRDISITGLSFIANAGRSPHVGQEVGIKSESGKKLGEYHVVRVHPSAGGLVIVGCRKGPATRAPLQMPRPSVDVARQTVNAVAEAA